MISEVVALWPALLNNSVGNKVAKLTMILWIAALWPALPNDSVGNKVAKLTMILWIACLINHTTK
jgi:hypothetical protein